MMTWGAIDPWDVAAERLTAFGKGPFIPINKQYNVSWSGDPLPFPYRRPEYIIASRLPETLSTFSVEVMDQRVSVDEHKFGMVYLLLSCVCGYGVIIWQWRGLLRKKVFAKEAAAVDQSVSQCH